MIRSKSCLVIIVCLWGLAIMPFVAAAADTALSTTGTAMSEAQMMGKLDAPARAWIKQEAARARASNRVSESAIRQSVQAAGSGVDFSNMDIEEICILVLMAAAHDAREDLKQIMADMEQTMAKKKRVRDGMQRQKTAQAAKTDHLRQEYSAQQAQPVIARSAALENFLKSNRLSYESLGDVSQEQQRKLQLVLDHVSKAEAAISDLKNRPSHRVRSPHEQKRQRWGTITGR